MNGKTLTTFALGAATGFVAGGIFVVKKVIMSEQVQRIVVKAVAEKLIDWIFKDDNREESAGEKR